MTTQIFSTKIFTLDINATSFSSYFDFITSSEKKSTLSAFCNVHLTIEALFNKSFNYCLSNFDFRLPDGAPLAFIAKAMFPFRKVEKISGPDLVTRLVRHCADNNKSIFFLGSSNDVLSSLSSNLTRISISSIFFFFASLRSIFTTDDLQKFSHVINKFSPDFLLIGLGCPKQEIVAFDLSKYVSCHILCVGAAFDFLAYPSTRAPAWLQSISLEWAYRLFSNPKRLAKRYLYTNTVFLVLLPFFLLINLLSRIF